MALVNKGKAGTWFDSGKGKIEVINAPLRGMEERLLAITEKMVDALGLSIVILSVDTGKHVPNSRHYKGRAEDITDAHAYGHDPEPMSLNNSHAAAMVDWLVAEGWTAGHESGPHDALLLGPVGTRWNETQVPHEHHLHVSIRKG